jgi:rod shape-determining protein MreB and related proteins
MELTPPGKSSMSVSGVFSDDIAIDLGTANTLVHAVGRGVVIDEPSVVAVANRGATREVVAVGLNAKTLVAREPGNFELLWPLRDGVIADFVATSEMLRDFIARTKTMLGFRRPQILICVPAGATPVERRAVIETAQGAGARKVYIVEEPVAAALGAGLPVDESMGAMVIDVGGGTTDIAVLAGGDVIEARSLRVAGNAMDEAIVRYMRRTHHLLVGEVNAERIKVEAGSASKSAPERNAEIHISGQDLETGRMKKVVLGPEHVAEALDGVIESMAEFIVRAIEDLPPENSRAVRERGLYLTGGGALLHRLESELAKRTGVKFHRTENPTQCVVKGSAIVLERLSEHRHLLIDP